MPPADTTLAGQNPLVPPADTTRAGLSELPDLEENFQECDEGEPPEDCQQPSHSDSGAQTVQNGSWITAKQHKSEMKMVADLAAKAATEGVAEKTVERLERQQEKPEKAFEEVAEWKRQYKELEEDVEESTVVIDKMFRKQKLTGEEKEMVENCSAIAARMAGHLDGKWS